MQTKTATGLMASGRFISVDCTGSTDKTFAGPKPWVGDKLLALCTGLASEAASRQIWDAAGAAVGLVALIGFSTRTAMNDR